MTRKKTLVEIMAGDSTLTTGNQDWDAPVVLQPTSASNGTKIPTLPEWATALMIMHGIKAKWVINYWLISNKYGAENGVSARDDYEEWMIAIKQLAAHTSVR